MESTHEAGMVSTILDCEDGSETRKKNRETRLSIFQRISIDLRLLAKVIKQIRDFATVRDE